jgi:hypothetical protein
MHKHENQKLSEYFPPSDNQNDITLTIPPEAAAALLAMVAPLINPKQAHDELANARHALYLEDKTEKDHKAKLQFLNVCKCIHSQKLTYGDFCAWGKPAFKQLRIKRVDLVAIYARLRTHSMRADYRAGGTILEIAMIHDIKESTAYNIIRPREKRPKKLPTHAKRKKRSPLHIAHYRHIAAARGRDYALALAASRQR